VRKDLEEFSASILLRDPPALPVRQQEFGIFGSESHFPFVGFGKIDMHVFVDFIEKSNLLEAQVTVLTPYPGTPLHKRLKRKGRLLTDAYWERCTMFDINFRPQNVTPEELEAGLLWIFGEIYNEEEYLKRKRYYMDIIKTLP
jgi:hypothetical protein